MRTTKTAVALTASALLLGVALSAAAAELTADQIVEKANHASYYQGKDGRADVKMTITDSQGQTRTKAFIILRRDDPNPKDPADDTFCRDQKFYVYFRLPPDERNTAFMVWKRAALDQDDDRWLYLPALDLVKRIASTEKRTSFVGSNFFYEDVSGRSINEDTHELTKTDDNYYVLKHTPKNPQGVEFAYYVTYIHKATFLPVSTQYYDAAGEKYREYTVLKVEQIQGFNTVTSARMTDHRAKGSTTIEYSDVRYNVNLPEDIFSERYLRRAPREYLK